MTSPRPVEDQTLMRYSERYFTEEYLPAQQATSALIAHIDSILELAEPARVASPTLFELGVGGGNLLTRARERGWTVAGTDVNSASVTYATSRGLNVWRENADHAASLGGSYGAVISEMSLEHVRHPERFCQLAADALVPGGRLVIYTVSAEGESFGHAGMASPLAGPAEHLFLFSAGSLVSLCQRAGLRVESVWRNHTADEIGIIATKRRDIGNPAVLAPAADDSSV
jgi:SAM-dependent methyltransferase